MLDSIKQPVETIGGVKTTDFIKDNGVLKPKGHVKVKSFDTDGNVVQETESDNLVVTTGVSSLIFNMINDTQAGSLTNHFKVAASYDEAYIKYIVLGTAAAAVANGNNYAYSDGGTFTLASVPTANNGSANANGPKSIFGASGHGTIAVTVLPSGATISNATGLRFTLTLNDNEGNGSASLNYTEAGLLWGIAANGADAAQSDFILFSRVTFSAIEKTSTRSITLDWTFSLTG